MSSGIGRRKRRPWAFLRREILSNQIDREGRGLQERLYMSLAPLGIDGKVLVGVSGGELGVRGFVAAYDAQTGKELWKSYTVPPRCSAI